MSFWYPRSYSGNVASFVIQLHSDIFFSHSAGDSTKFSGSFPFQLLPSFPLGVWSKSLLNKGKIFPFQVKDLNQAVWWEFSSSSEDGFKFNHASSNKKLADSESPEMEV